MAKYNLIRAYTAGEQWHLCCNEVDASLQSEAMWFLDKKTTFFSEIYQNNVREYSSFF